MLVLPKPKTMTYGLNFVSYAAARYWISLPNSFRRITSPKEFRRSPFTHSFTNETFIITTSKNVFLCKYFVL